MAFTPALFAVQSQTVFGDRRVVMGTYVNTGGSTGGDIITGLSVVEFFILQPTGASALALAPVVNETFPMVNSNGAVTIVSNANDTGNWLAIGR